MPGFEENLFIDLTKREANYLLCSICLSIFDNAVISVECGHSFCKSCVQQWIEGKHNTCPKCKTQFTRKRDNSEVNSHIIGKYVFKPNFTANGIISQLKTNCKFQLNGCQEVIEFGLLSAHLKSCQHRLCSKCGHTAEAHDCTTTQPSIERSRQSIENCIKSLIHANQCTDSECQSTGKPSCNVMKAVINHAKSSQHMREIKKIDNCPTCKHLTSLCVYHAKKCQLNDCPVPFCSEIKRKLFGLGRHRTPMSQESAHTSA